MLHSASFLRLDRITPPLEQISHIWTSLHQIDRNYITSFVGDVPMLSTRRVDWNFLGAAVTFWDPTHAVFNIQVDRIDAALASVILQVVGDRGYESHASPFGLVRPVLFFNHSESIISRLLPLVHVEERKATEEYILRFYRQSSSVHEDFTGSPQPEGNTPYGTPSTSSIAVQAELTSLRSEKDRLRWEVVEKDEQLIDQRQLQRELQRELAQARAELQRRDQELAHANATLERSKKRSHGGSGPASGSGPAFTALGFGPTSGSGPVSGFCPTFTALGFGLTSGSGPAFTFGFRPCIELRPHFWASALHRASAPLLGSGPAFTTFRF
ncbi:hypothetical protein CRG98_031309 [Punica granatum]|uniref:Uncharacterized protein n=1 Tax=Punica granatum TaxID=22663 RepID=A0A2I0IXA6_PUNGR|nr:hypothetical protein CRG98_031309 [Punica granatum]